MSNKKIVNYFNITLVLNEGTYKPYTKPNNNTYTKTQTIHQVSSSKSHYPENQGYLPYLLTKK